MTKIFFLKNPKAEVATLIYLIHRLPNGDRLKYSTGESIHPDQWDKENQKALTHIKRNNEQLTRNKSVNFQLDRYSMKLTEVVSAAKTQNHVLTGEMLRDELDREFKKEPTNKKTLFGFIRNHINTVKLTRTTPPKPISRRTLQKYNTTERVLLDFAQQRRKGKLDFKDIDLGFYADFTEFLQKEYRHTTNTIGKYIQVVKIFMREAVDAGITTNIQFEHRKFATVSEAVEHPYLTEDELTQLWELNLTGNRRLEAVRDLFLIGCYTALRFSDFTAIRAENIVNTEGGGRAIKIRTYKTNQMVFVPLHWRVASIIDKYNNCLPRAISNQKMNEYLKELGKLAGIDTPYEVNKTKGGMRISEVKPKHELITTHTARRSAATNMFKAGIPSISIMKLTGHTTEAVFLKYINLSEEENARLLMGHKYFTAGRMKAV